MFRFLHTHSHSPTRSAIRLCALSACAALLALAQAAAPVFAAPPPPDNLKLALQDAFGIFAEGNYAAFGVSESRQGEDLSGDGDLQDTVVYAWDSANLRILKSKVPMRGNKHTSFCLNGNVLAFAASEDGNHDFNGDGDTSDNVLARWDLVADDIEVGNVAMSAGVGVTCGGGRIGYRVSEADQGGRDHNGDGDAVDTVWHVYRLSDGNNHNLELSAIATMQATGRMNGYGLVFEHDETTADEDYNLDGDLDDKVIFNYVFSNGLTFNSGLNGLLHYDMRSNTAKAYGRFVPFRADEAEEGEDLNNDGDMTDVVGMAVDSRNGNIKHGAAGDIVRSTSRWLTLVVDEATDGNVDLTGDGDTNDDVLVFQHAFNGSRWNTGFALSGNDWGLPYIQNDHGIGFTDRFVSATVDESATGYDINGNGIGIDRFVIRFNPSNNSAVHSDGFDRSCYDPENSLVADRSYALTCRWETALPATDLNGDGDISDKIAQVVRLSNGTVTSTDYAIDRGDPMHIGGGLGFFLVDEAAHGAGSLNGDGDTNDDVLHIVDLSSGAVINAGMDVHVLPSTSDDITLWAQNRGHMIFAASESAQGYDLNGDGDTGDLVMHAQSY